MADKQRRTRSSDDSLKLLRATAAIPPDFLKRRMAAADREVAARLKAREAGAQAEKLFRRIKKPGKPKLDPKSLAAANGLLDIHKRLGKRTLALPKLPSQHGGLVFGGFKATFVPPFDYAFAKTGHAVGNATTSSSASKNTGAINCKAVTEFAQRNTGSAYAEVGVFFHPTSGPGRLRVSANPTYSRQFWTNSLGTEDLVTSFGSVVVGMFGQQGRTGPTSGNVDVGDLWEVQTTATINFDLGSSPPIPMTAELEVDPSFSFSVFVAAQVMVHGVGWPGSLAGAMIALLVPSITIEFELIPILTQD